MSQLSLTTSVSLISCIVLGIQQGLNKYLLVGFLNFGLSL